MMEYLTLDDVEVDGSRVLLRADLNVPLVREGAVSTVGDEFRLRSALPTVARLRDEGAVVVVASHLGRPDGFDPAFSMAPVAERMTQLAGFEVTQLPAVVGSEVETAIAGAQPGDVLLLENTRFEPGEKRNAPELASALAAPVDLFVNDAFGTAHRAHASNVGVAEHVKSVAGPLLIREVAALTNLLTDPAPPFVVLLGGAKVSDKLGVIKSLLPKVDLMLIGGGMCFTLLAAEGYEIGSSLFEKSMLDEVRSVLHSEYRDRVLLPRDLVVAERFAEDSPHETVSRQAIPDDMMGLDIGPETAAMFAQKVTEAGSVFWNGPMGVFEWDAFRAGTAAVAAAMGDTTAHTVVGGGDSVAAVRRMHVDDKIDHVSTGGGAGLELLEGKELPGLVALAKWV